MKSSITADTTISHFAAAADSPVRSQFALMGRAPIIVLAAIVVPSALLYGTLMPSSLHYWHFTPPTDATPDHLERILKTADMGNKTVILTTLNAAWAEPGSVLDLFLDSFRIGDRTRELVNHMVIIAMDQTANERCTAVHPHCFDLNTTGSNLSAQKDYMTPDYLQMMWRRLDFQREVLEKGYSFIFTDMDILWFRNPLSHFYPDGDFQVSCDRFFGNATDLENMPSNGFNHVKSNNKSIPFFKYWYSSRLKYPKDHDQAVFNYIKHDVYLREIGLEIRFLDTKYFNGLCEKTRDWNTICTMHANCRVGLASKLNELRAMISDWKKHMSEQH